MRRFEQQQKGDIVSKPFTGALLYEEWPYVVGIRHFNKVPHLCSGAEEQLTLDEVVTRRDVHRSFGIDSATVPSSL